MAGDADEASFNFQSGQTVPVAMTRDADRVVGIAARRLRTTGVARACQNHVELAFERHRDKAENKTTR